MTKKKNEKEPVIVDVPKEELNSEEVTTTSLDESRKKLVEGFNQRFGEYAEIVDKGTCTEEYQNQCKEDFEKLVTDFQGKTFELAEKENALETAKFLKEWNEKCAVWEGDSWKGVLLFDTRMSEAIEKIENGDEGLVVDYGALIYLYGTMSRRQGTGLESAKLMEVLETDNRSEEAKKEDKVEAVTFSNIYKRASSHVEVIKLIDAKMNLYQQRWSMAASGFELNFKISDLTEFGKFAEALKNAQ